MKEKIKKCLLTVLFPIIVVPAIVQASETGLRLMHPVTDTRAEKILERAYRYIASMRRLSFDAVLTNEDSYEGKMVVELKHHIEVWLQRPDHLRIDISGESRNRSYFLRNGLLTIFDHTRNLYAETKVPGSIDGALDFAYEHYAIETPLANILYSDLFRRLKPKVKGYYFGTSYAGGVLCDHIGFVDRKASFQIWVAKGEKPLIRRYVIVDKTTPMRLHSTVEIDWKSDREISEGLFTFPTGQKRRKIEMIRSEGAVR